MKIKNKIGICIIAIIIFILINLNYVSSLGITPGRTTINFEPGLEQEVSFSILNSESKDMSIVFYIQGELNNSIELEQGFVEFSSKEDAKSFKYKVRLPDKFDKPGLHAGEIVALELPKDLKQGGSVVGATVAVVTQLYVYVPYPGKYIDLDANIIEAGPNQTTTFIVAGISRGKLDIVKAKAIIEIYTGLNQLVDRLETEEIGILSGERKELVVKWDTNVNPGKYRAKITMVYDNEITSIEKIFSVGEMKLEIEQIVVKDFNLGEIAKFNILVDNTWSQEIKDAFVNILVYNNENEIMADFKSPNYNIAGLSKEEMVAYWDTGGVKKGTYDGKLILKYGEEQSERNVKIKITSTSIEVMGAVTGHAIIPGRAVSTTTLLIILVSVLVAINIIWFVIFLRKKKKKTSSAGLLGK